MTIDAHDVPWIEALADVTSQVGAAVREEDGVIYIEPPGTDTRTAAPSGVVERGARVEVRKLSAEASATGAVPLSEGITPPKLVIRIDPKYTEDAKAARIAGMVIIATEIDELGNVASAEVRKPLPFGLSAAALDAVKQWKFEPAMKDGKPVRVKFNITVNFKPDGE